MWTYAAVLSLLGLLALLSVTLPKQAVVHMVLLPFSVIVLVLFIGLRDQVGADWDTYQTIFDSYSHVDAHAIFTTAPIEPSYAALNYIAHIVGCGIYFVNLICAMVMLLGLIRFADLVDIDAVLTLFLSAPYLLFAVGMGYTRQAVAIGLGFAALAYWASGEQKKFILGVLLAISFHFSAVFLFLLVWMKNWKRILAAVPLAFVAGYIFITMIYTHYFSLYVQNTDDLHSNGVWFRLAIVLLGIGIAFIQARELNENPRLFGLVKAGASISLFLIPLAIVASTFADRICLYLLFIYLIAMAKMTRFTRIELRPMALAGIYTTTYLCFFAWFIASSYAARSWIPYRNILIGKIGS